MKKGYFYLLVFLLFFIGKKSFSQQRVSMPAALIVKKNSPSFVPSSATIFRLRPQDPAARPVPCFPDGGIHYPGFFCQMELKAVDHFHIWIKFHAGDYDRYMHITDTYR